MGKKKIFVSSVQNEFTEERKILHEYIVSDPLLGRFFEPFQFIQDESFRTIIYRPNAFTGLVTGQVIGQATVQVDEFVKRIIMILEGEMKRSELMNSLQLTHRENFITNYLDPAMKGGFIEQKYPENPNHPNQKYRLTNKGKEQKNKRD